MGGNRWILLLLLLVVILLIILWWGGCLRRPFSDVQPPNVIVFAPLPGLGPGAPGVTARTRDIPSSAYQPFTPPVTKPPMAAAPTDEKTHPLIPLWMSQGRGAERTRFVVLWDDPIPMLRFPELNLLLPLMDAVNDSARSRAIQRVDVIRGLRRPVFAVDTAGYATAEINGIESYWLVQAMLLEMTVAQADSIAARPGVVYVQPDSSGEAPPDCDTTPPNDAVFISDARERISSEPYFQAGYPPVWMSLLDTGVRGDHELLSGTGSHMAGLAECVSNSDCSNEDPSDIDAQGHGTGSAAIITGDNSWNERFRGVTKMDLHSYRVYKGSSPRIQVSAVVRGFERGAIDLDRVIVAEVQSKTNDKSSIAKAADNAFTTGAVVIAASGNYGSTEPLPSPANARCAASIGAYVFSTGDTDPGESYGTTADLRQKPDLQAPSYTWTAGNASPTSCKEFAQSSGATPYAGGAAALLWGWLKHSIGSDLRVDPGQVMAMLMTSTEMSEVANQRVVTPETGTGRLRLPTDGWGWYGKVPIEDTDKAVDIPIDLTGLDPKELDVALWWPEQLVTQSGRRKNTHNDIDLYLIRPDDHEYSQTTADGVFERLTVPVRTSDRKEWTLRVHGFELKKAPQDVYFVVVARRMSGGGGPINPP